MYQYIVSLILYLGYAIGGRGMDFDARELLARIIKCEAQGEGEIGMKAVATVIMNRVQAIEGEYLRVGQGSIHNIVKQPGQFTCAQETINEELNPNSIYTNVPEQIHYDIADWALAGNKVPGLENALWFYSPPGGGACRPTFPALSGKFIVRINNHCFYNPTSHYKNT